MTTFLHSVGAVPAWTVGDRVRKARDYAGMNQGDLAEATGMARSGLARIEQGGSTPRRSSLRLIALATGVDLYWLKTGKTPIRPEPNGGSQNVELCAIRDSNPEPTDLYVVAA